MKNEKKLQLAITVNIFGVLRQGTVGFVSFTLVECVALHCGLRYTKKLTDSDSISNIKKVYLRNFYLLDCFLDLLWNFENVFFCFVYNLIEPEIQL